MIVAYDQDEYARRIHYDRPIASIARGPGRRPGRRAWSCWSRSHPTSGSAAGEHSDSGRYSVDDWLVIYAATPTITRRRSGVPAAGSACWMGPADPGGRHRPPTAPHLRGTSPVTGWREDSRDPPAVPCRLAGRRRERDQLPIGDSVRDGRAPRTDQRPSVRLRRVPSRTRTAVSRGTRLMMALLSVACLLGSAAPAAASSGSYQDLEKFALSLVNCTRTGGWVRPDGSCKGRGSGKYSAYRKPLTLSAGISSKVSRKLRRQARRERLLRPRSAAAPSRVVSGRAATRASRSVRASAAAAATRPPDAHP